MKKKSLLITATAITMTSITATVGMFLYLSDMAIRRMQPKIPMPVRRQVCHIHQDDIFRETRENAKAGIKEIPYIEMSLKSHDGYTLYGKFFRAAEEKRIIIFFHGWRSSWESDFSINVSRLLNMGCSLLLVDQRCHGKSEGEYIAYGIKERYDCLHWTEQMAKRFPDLPIYLWGLSMGASTVMMASGLPLPSQVKGIIADCGYTSPEEIMRHLLKKNTLFGDSMVLAVYREHFIRNFDFDIRGCSTTEMLSKNKLPVLFFHGKDDDFVPLSMTFENYDVAKGEKDLILIDGAAHGKCFFVDGDTCLGKITAFFEKHDR